MKNFLKSELISGSRQGACPRARCCVNLCERRPEGHSLAVVVDDVMLVPIEREPKDALVQLLVDDWDEREVLHVTGALYSRG